MTRATLYVLLPMALRRDRLRRHGPAADARMARHATTLEGANQTIALGPVASQEAIKQLGTNGGGFFNVNAAHPFENPTAFANYLNIFAMLS
jgi:K+-transporting ATPase ATPase A chain